MRITCLDWDLDQEWDETSVESQRNSTPLSKDLKERVRFHLELWLGRNNTAYLIEKAGEFRRGSNHNEFVPSLLSTSAYMYVP